MAIPADDPRKKSLAPYLSIVIVGRNDDYGQDFMSRLNTFVRSLDYQLARHPGLAEIIIVEWNPLADRPGLSKALVSAPNIDLRIITVPEDIHQSIGHPWPVLEFYGKNVGIRRARGEFVLITNPDILFTDALIDALATRPLDERYFFRTDRYDFHGQGINNVDAEDLISFAVANVFQAHLVVDEGSWSPSIEVGTPMDYWPRSTGTNPHTNAAGDFLLAARDRFFSVNGLWESTTQLYHMDSISMFRLMCHGTNQACIIGPGMAVLHQHHERGPIEPWDPIKIMSLAQPLGGDQWGLNGIDLLEWSNQ